MCLSCIYRGRPCEPLLQLYVYITKDRVVQLCLRPILRRRNLKTEVSLWKRIKCFPSALDRRNLKTPQSPVILDSYLKKKKNRARKSHDHREVIVLKNLRFRNAFCPHENEKPAFSNSSGLMSVFVKLCFRDGLVWTVGLTVEIKLRFQIPPPSVEWT